MNNTIKFYMLKIVSSVTISFHSGFGLISLSLQVHQDDLVFSELQKKKSFNLVCVLMTDYFW